MPKLIFQLLQCIGATNLIGCICSKLHARRWIIRHEFITNLRILQYCAACITKSFANWSHVVYAPAYQSHRPCHIDVIMDASNWASLILIVSLLAIFRRTSRCMQTWPNCSYSIRFAQDGQAFCVHAAVRYANYDVCKDKMDSAVEVVYVGHKVCSISPLGGMLKLNHQIIAKGLKSWKIQIRWRQAFMPLIGTSCKLQTCYWCRLMCLQPHEIAE